MVGVRWCFGIALATQSRAEQTMESLRVVAIQALVEESRRAGGRQRYAVATAIAMKMVGPRNTQKQAVLPSSSSSSSPPKPVSQIHWRCLWVPGESEMLNNDSEWYQVKYQGPNPPKSANKVLPNQSSILIDSRPEYP